MKAFGQALAAMNPADVVAALDGEGTMTLDINGEPFEITKELVDVKISAKEGFAVAMENNVFTILDTTITPELEAEGLAREIISKIQQMRKQKDYEMMDNISISIDADETVAAAVELHKDYIMTETLAVSINASSGLPEADINGHKTGLDVERV